MIAQWNSVVGEFDTVYHLGDVVINQKHLHKIARLNGKKKLIMGNHDIFGFQKYKDAGFYEICSYRVFVDEFVCSHIPLHPDCISDRFITNIHGHLHGNDNMWQNQQHELRHTQEKDPRYYSVCVEKLDDYKPIAHEDLKIAIKKRQEEANYTPTTRGWGNGSGPG
jgi:calcineurin-like phosphoesterase family protein